MRELRKEMVDVDNIKAMVIGITREEVESVLLNALEKQPPLKAGHLMSN